MQNYKTFFINGSTCWWWRCDLCGLLIKFTLSLKQLVVSKCLVPCSPFQAILGKRCHAVLLEDVVTGLFLYGHQPTAPISPGGHLQLGLPGLELQTGVLAHSPERRKGSLGYSLSSCHVPKSICCRSWAFNQCFPQMHPTLQKQGSLRSGRNL